MPSVGSNRNFYKNACSTLARTFDLVRFFARSASSTTPLCR
jgi:hypothetical protein